MGMNMNALKDRHGSAEVEGISQHEFYNKEQMNYTNNLNVTRSE